MRDRIHDVHDEFVFDNVKQAFLDAGFTEGGSAAGMHDLSAVRNRIIVGIVEPAVGQSHRRG